MTKKDGDTIADKWLDDELNNMNISRAELIEALKIKKDGLFSDIEGVSDNIKNIKNTMNRKINPEDMCILFGESYVFEIQRELFAKLIEEGDKKI